MSRPGATGGPARVHQPRDSGRPSRQPEDLVRGRGLRSQLQLL